MTKSQLKTTLSNIRYQLDQLETQLSTALDDYNVVIDDCESIRHIGIASERIDRIERILESL